MSFDRSFTADLSSMSEQLSEGGKNLVEDEKMRRKLAIDNEELQAALEEAEGILEQESAKLVKVKKWSISKLPPYRLKQNFQNIYLIVF